MKDILKERAASRRQQLSILNQNEEKLSKTMNDYERGYEFDTSTLDLRSNYEKSIDKNYMSQKIRTKLNVLFNNDAIEITTFLDFLNQNNISLDKFNSVYNELLKLTDAETLTANEAIAKFYIILNNFEKPPKKLNENSSKMIDDIDLYNFLVKFQTQLSRYNINEKEKIDINDRIEAILNNNTKYFDTYKNELKQIVNKDVNSVIDMISGLPMKKKPGRKKGSKNKPKENNNDVKI